MEKNLYSWILTNTLYHRSIMNTLHFSVGPCKMKTFIYLHIYKTVFLEKNLCLPLFSSPMVEWFVSWWNGCSVDFWQQTDPLCIKIGKITYVHDRYIQTLYSTPKSTSLSLISVSAIVIDSGQIMKQITAQFIWLCFYNDRNNSLRCLIV